MNIIFLPGLTPLSPFFTLGLGEYQFSDAKPFLFLQQHAKKNCYL